MVFTAWMRATIYFKLEQSLQDKTSQMYVHLYQHPVGDENK